MSRTRSMRVRAAEHQTTGQVGLSRMSYGHWRRRGLIVPNPDPQFWKSKRTPNRENEDRLQTGPVSDRARLPLQAERRRALTLARRDASRETR